MPHRGNLGKAGSVHGDTLETQPSSSGQPVWIEAKNPAGMRTDRPRWSHAAGNDFICGGLNKQRR